MKRNILLGFLLIGLVVMEWGCWRGKCEALPDQNYIITGFRDFYMDDCFGALVKDSISYDSVFFAVKFETELLVSEFSPKIGQFGLYATSCPPSRRVCITKFDSVSVTTIVNGQSIDLSSNIGFFSGRSNQGERCSKLIAPILDKDGIDYISCFDMDRNPNFAFGILEAPNYYINSGLTFQFFDTEGNIFETTTDPIVITP